MKTNREVKNKLTVPRAHIYTQKVGKNVSFEVDRRVYVGLLEKTCLLFDPLDAGMAQEAEEGGIFD